MTTERPVLKARMGSPAAAKALIDKSSSDPRCPIFVCEGTVAEGGVGRISSCLNASSSGDAIEKKRARIPTPPSQLTHPIRRGTVERESVQPAKAAKPTDNAQVFTLAPIPTPRNKSIFGGLLCMSEKVMLGPDFLSSGRKPR